MQRLSLLLPLLAVTCGRDALDLPTLTSPTPAGGAIAGGAAGGATAGPGGSGGTGAIVPDAAVPIGPPSVTPPPPIPLPTPAPLPDAAVPVPPPIPVPPPPPPGGPACAALPGCLAKSTAGCPTTGACTQQMSGLSSNQCYANGVRVSTTFSLAASSAVSTVNQPGGAACYTVQTSGAFGGPRGGAPGAKVTFMDASGAVFATGTFQGAGQLVVGCADGSMPATIPIACAPGLSGLVDVVVPGNDGCSAGACP